MESLRNEVEESKKVEELKCKVAAITAKYEAELASSKSLRRAYDDQASELQQAKSLIEKRGLEIDTKVDEISLVNRMYENLKYDFSEKELVVKHLSLANEKLKSSFKKEVMKLEGTNNGLASSLDEAKSKVASQEEVIRGYMQEIYGLRSLLSHSNKKCVDLEEANFTKREIKSRDEMLLMSEKDKEDLQSQLKWKVEQFKHLEDAHSRSQAEFAKEKKAYVIEKSNLLHEISALQTNLDSQTRASENLQLKLEMCNQSLAHVESQRKLLRVQLSQSRELYDGMIVEYEEAKLNVEKLMGRDDEIASLRTVLATKETYCKEIELRNIHLEMDNQQLLTSFKDFQDDQLTGADAATNLKCLHQKFKALEQTHKACPDKLKTRELEWKKQLQMLQEDIDACRITLHVKDEHAQNLQLDMECYSSFALQQKLENEELGIVIGIYASKYSEFCSYVEYLISVVECYKQEAERKMSLLTEQLEKNAFVLLQSQNHLKSELVSKGSLLERIDHLESIEQQYFLIQKEIKIYKEKIENLSDTIRNLIEESTEMISSLQENLMIASEDVVHVNSIVAEKTNELVRVNFELQQVKLDFKRTEKLTADLLVEQKNCHDKDRELREELQACHLAKMETKRALLQQRDTFHKNIEEKDMIITELQKLTDLLKEDLIKNQFQYEKAIEHDKLKLISSIEYERERLENIVIQIDLLEQGCKQKKNETIAFEAEKLKYLQFMKAKLDIILDIEQKGLALEKELTNLIEMVNLKLADRVVESRKFSEALEKLVAVIIIGQQDIQLKDLQISEMEDNISTLQSKFETEKHTSLERKECIDELKNHSLVIENELKSMEYDNRSLLHCMEVCRVKTNDLERDIDRLSLERKALLEQMSGFHDLIGETLHEDKELMKSMRQIMQNVGCEIAEIHCNEQNICALDEDYEQTTIQKCKNGQILFSRCPL